MTVDTDILDLKTDLAQNVDKTLQVGDEDVVALMKYYNITPDILKDMVYCVREWYGKQPHLPSQLHDRKILGHLMLRGFSVERTKRNLENFYTARRRLPELLCGRELTNKEWLCHIERGYWFILPKKTDDNYRVSIFRMSEDGGSVVQMVRLAFLILEYRMWNDAAMGDCWIMDFRNATLQQALQWTPMLVTKTIYFLTACFGTKLKSVHLINLPSFGATALNLFKKGIKAKIADRLHIANAEDLLDNFSKDVLPVEYGGTEVSCQKITAEWLKSFQSEPWSKYFAEQDTVLADDTKRLTPSKADEVFGIDGSFRKLELD